MYDSSNEREKEDDKEKDRGETTALIVILLINFAASIRWIFFN